MKKNGVVFGLLFLLQAAFFAGCNVGLGESIDVDSPVLEIKYPPIAATIRDKFILYGTWGDDKGVTSVAVSLVNTDTKEKVGSFLATVNSDKTWQLELNEFDNETGKFKYIDGSYQVSAAAYDAAGHTSGESSRTFDIDNSAPVFVISNPGVVKSENLDASAYGSVFTIDGTIADDHTISLMDVAIYDEDGNLLSHETYDSEQVDFFREEEIATAGGTSVTIAQFADNPTTTANNRYSNVYGTDSKAGTKKYYASVTVTDSAKVYQNPTEKERSAIEAKSDSFGNSTSNVYLYDDVYTTLMSAKKGLGLSAADLKNILNGTETNEAALAVLNEKVRATSESEDNRLYFSLNPEANPTYTISGYALDFSDESSIQQASNGNTVTVTVNAGLDGVNVNPATVKLWMLQFDSMPTADEASSKASALAAKVKSAESAASADGEKTISDEKLAEIESEGWRLVFENSDYQGSSVSVKSMAMMLPSNGILMNKYYLLVVTGSDADDVEFSQKSAFGFKGTVSGIAPTIFIKSPMNGDFVVASDLVFSGTAMVNNPSLSMSELKATITASDGSSILGNQSGYSVSLHYNATSEEENPVDKWSAEEAFKVISSAKDADSGVDVFTWEFDPSKISGFSSDATGATKYTLDVYGSSSSGHDVTASSMVQLDVTPPDVKITTITPTVSGADVSDAVKASDGYNENNVYINGTIRIMGSIVEPNLKTVKYDVLASHDLNADFSEKNSDGSYKYSILDVMYEDSDGYYDGELDPSNSIDVLFDTTKVTEGMLRSGAIEKDSPIKIRVVFTAIDKVNNSASYSSAEYNGGNDFLIYQETDKPKIKFGNADESITNSEEIQVGTNLFGTTNNNKLQVTVSDDDSVKNFKIHVLDANGTTEVASENVAGGKTIVDKSYTLPDSEGKYQIKVEAFDEYFENTSSEYAKNTVGPFFVAVDSGAPNIEISSPTAGSFQSRQVDVEGFVKKPNVKVSGTLYSVSGENLTPISNGTSGTQVGSDISTLASPNSLGEYIWTDTVMLPSDANGGYKLEYTATDSYGQTAASSRAFVVDITPPRFAITELDSVSVASTVRSVVTNKDVYTVKGTISDGEATSGIKDVYYKIVSDGNNPETVTDSFGRTIYNVDSTGWERAAVAATTSKGEYTFTANVEIGTYTRVNGTEFKKVYFAVKDEAGNVSVPSECSDSSSLRISLDTVPPATTLEGTGLKKPASSLSSSVTGTKDDAGNLVLSANAVIYSDITYYATGDYSIGGTITEASDTATVKVDGTSATVTGSKWTFPGKTADGTYTHQIVISDAAGNSSNTSVSVIRDTVPPTLIVSNDTTDNDALNENKIITEENGNYSTEIDTSGKTVHKYLLSGKWSDSTSGTSILQYQVYPKHEGGANYSEDWGEWRTVDGVTKSTAESSWTISVPMTEGNGLGQGVGLRGRAVDAAGNVRVHSGHEGLTLDFSVPEISLTSVVPSYVKEGETLTITGTCSDSYALDKLECTAKKKGATVESGSNGYTFTYIPGTANLLGQVKNGTFEIKVESGSTNNGNWTFDLAVTDKANRTTKLDTISTVIDTVKPSWSTFLVNKNEYSYTNENEHSWYKSSALPFAGTLSEEGSGIREIVYSVIQAGSGGTATYSKSFATTKDDDGTESFSVNLGEFISNVSGGNAIPNDVYMKAIDYAGNESEVQVFHIYIDAEEPSLLCDRSGNVYSDLETAISVTGTMDDDASGVSSVKLTISDTATGSSFTPIIIDATLDSDSEWHAKITKDDVLSNLEDGHIYAVKAAVTDKAENSSSSTIFRIHIDKTPPYVQTYSVSNSLSKYKVHSAGNDEYFVHNSNTFKDEDGNIKKDAGGNVVEDDRNIFTISGVAMDSSSGVEKVEFTLTNTKDSSKKIEKTATSSIFNFDDIDLTGWEGGAVGRFVITDGAGNQGDKYNGETEEFEIKLNFDNDAPKGIHAIDGTGKDIFLRVGDNDNDEVAPLTDNDKKVGGKYSVDTYGNEQTIKLRGTISDGSSGSGISMIYYKVIPSGNTPQEQASLKVIADKFLEEYETDTENTGYFKPNRTEDKRVFYTPLSGGKVYDADGNDVVFSDSDSVFSGFAKDFGTTDSKNYATITTNYDNVFSGFDVGVNYVVLVTVDNVGNAALDSVNVVEPSGKSRYYNYSLNVDTESPDAKAFGETTKYATATGTVVIEGEAIDDASGIKSVVIKVNDKQIKEDVNANDGSGTLIVGEQTTEDGTKKKKKEWRVELDAEKVFAGDNGTKTVYAIVTDKAGKGNKSTVSVANVIVDTQPPTVKLTAPKDADSEVSEIQINGTIKLEGTISDENVLPETAITGIKYRMIKAADGTAVSNSTWTDLTLYQPAKEAEGDNPATDEVKGIKLSGSYTFTVTDFDTTTLDDGCTYQLCAVGVDAAGNSKESDPVTVIVSQDSDRPKVKINNLTPYGDSFILMYGTNAQVTGIVSDDDSESENVVKEFYMTEYPVSATKNTDGTYSVIETLSNGTTRTAVNKVLSSSWNTSTGEFTFEPSDKDDGQKHFYILVIDNNDNVFYTTATKAGATAGTTVSDTLALPKVTVTKKKIGATEPTLAEKERLNGTVFTYSSDGKNPTVGLAEGLPYATETSPVATDDKNTAFALSTNTTPTTNATLNSSFKVGGVDRRFVKFYFTANDASGIAGMTVEFKDDKGVSLEKLATAANIGSVDTGCTANGTFVESNDKNSNATWTTDFIDLASFKDSSGNDFAGQISVSVTPYDKAGLAGNGSCNFYVDNQPPKIEKIEPKTDSEVSGAVEISGNSGDNGVAGTSNIQWIVPNTTQVTTYNGKADDKKAEYLEGLSWNGGVSSLEKESTVTSWKFVFDGNYDEESSKPDEFKFNAGNPSFNVYDSADFAGDNITADGIYTLPIWFRAADALGNVAYETSYKYKHNPDADKPKLEFSYPTKENYKSATEKFAVLGGTIRVTGSAIIPSGKTTVNSIYYQIADSAAKYTGTADASAANTDSYKAKNTYGLTVVSVYDIINKMRGTSYSKNSTLSDDLIKGLGFKTKAEIDDWWGIEATGTASWNFKLNEDGKLNPSTGTNDITLRACGVNAEGKFGAWTSGDNEIAIHIDKSAPVITASVNKYGDGKTALGAKPTAEPTSSLPYDADMYLKGCWTLVATLLDESGLSGTTPYSVMKGDSSLAAGTGYFVEENISKEFTNSDGTTTTKTGVRLYIPIPKDLDSAEITVNASDTDHTSTQKFTFKIDETAPTLDKLIGNGLGFDETEADKKFKSIEDSNYRFTISGSSYDLMSGVKNIVFYYMRKNGTTGTIGTDVVMDPMIWSDEQASKVTMDSTIKAIPFTQGDDTYYLYAKSYSGSATTDTFTSGIAYDDHVRKGGLVYIDGVLRTITKLESNTVTFTPALSESKSSVSADFPIAQVIDNSASEKVESYNYASEKVESYSGAKITFESGDDGDGMPESFSKSASTWTWDAAIRSNNMPDGPVSLVILAFDNAGNVAERIINTKITNNAPRIAKVFLGTDLNGDENYTNSSSIEELVEYDILGAEGNKQSAYELDFTATNPGKNNTTTPKYKNGIFTIKSGLAVVPEFVGGNGEIAMVVDSAATTKAAVEKSADNTLIAKTSIGTVVTETNEDNETVNTVSKSFTGTVSGILKGSDASNIMYSYVIDKNKIGGDSDSKGISFTFWDTTEETEQGKTSQNAVLYVKNFKVSQNDSTPPTVVVNPFFWIGEGEDKNSLYGGLSANGHVELEDDWKNATGYDASNAEYDADPKVSGKIRFTGTAYDNFRLSSIRIKFDGFINETEVATYKKVSDEMQWVVPETTIESNGYVFRIVDTTFDSKGNAVTHGYYEDDAYFAQKGHKVYWTLDLDTEKISSKAKADVSLTVTATDAAGKTTNVASVTAPVVDSATNVRTVTDGTTNYPIYQMDVVPYIAGVKTGLSSLKKGNSSVYDRTALGHYPVVSTETIFVYGFNLKGGTLYDSAATPASAILTPANASGQKWYSTSAKPSGSVYSAGSISAFTSGEVYVLNGEEDAKVKSLNNLNNNGAYGKAYETAPTVNSTGSVYKDGKFYNRQPNGDSNNKLTDDVVLDVWQINSEAGKPNAGPLSQPVMAINPVNKQVGFAFANGPLHFSMGSLDKSYDVWEQGLDFWTSIGFAYDANGNSFGTTAGGDINGTPDSDAFGIFTSRWGKGLYNNKGGHNNGTGQLRLEILGQAESTDGTNFNGNNINKQRIKSPSIATTVTSTTATSTNVYLAYYDEVNDEIRFKWGIFSNGNNTTGRSQNNLFYDYYGPENGDGAKDSSSNTRSLTKTKTVVNLPYTLEYISLIAGQTKDKYTFVPGASGTKYTANTAVMTNEENPQPVCAGQYVCIAAKYQGGDTYNIGTEENPNNFTDDLVVAVWYDATNNQLLYSYNKAPQKIKAPTYKGNNYNTIDSYSQSATGWSTPVAVFGEGNGIGEYCKVALDANGKVHIACYDNANADVWYAYIDDYTSPSGAKTCIVDSYGIVGTELYLDVALKDGNPVPYISYYGSSCARPKVAYWASETSIDSAAEVNGAVEEAATGNWEVSVIPSSSKISIDHINVGVWKDSSGNLTYSTTNGNAPNGKTPGTSGANVGKPNAGTSSGMIYGNGSKNPILGYAITKGSGGYIETAQMK